MGPRISQLVTRIELVIALACAMWAVGSMVLFIHAVDPPGKPRVPAAILNAINAEKFNQLPGNPLLIVNATGALDQTAEAQNLVLLTERINPAPRRTELLVLTAICTLPIATLGLSILALMRGWNTVRRGTMIATFVMMPLAAFFWTALHADWQFRPFKHGNVVRHLEDQGALSIEKWNKQVDRGNLPPSARAEDSIAWVLYDTSGMTFSINAVYAFLLGTASLVFAPLLRWIWRNRWSVKNKERLAQART